MGCKKVLILLYFDQKIICNCCPSNSHYYKRTENRQHIRRHNDGLYQRKCILKTGTKEHFYQRNKTTIVGELDSSQQ